MSGVDGDKRIIRLYGEPPSTPVDIKYHTSFDTVYHSVPLTFPFHSVPLVHVSLSLS